MIIQTQNKFIKICILYYNLFYANKIVGIVKKLYCFCAVPARDRFSLDQDSCDCIRGDAEPFGLSSALHRVPCQQIFSLIAIGLDQSVNIMPTVWLCGTQMKTIDFNLIRYGTISHNAQTESIRTIVIYFDVGDFHSSNMTFLFITSHHNILIFDS